MEQYWTRTKIHVCYLAGQNVNNKVVLDWTEIHLSYHANKGVHHEPYWTRTIPYQIYIFSQFLSPGKLVFCYRAGVLACVCPNDKKAHVPDNSRSAPYRKRSHWGVCNGVHQKSVHAGKRLTHFTWPRYTRKRLINHDKWERWVRVCATPSLAKKKEPQIIGQW